MEDETWVRVEYGPAGLIVDVMGMAYSIAECGEQLSWLACAIRVPPAGSVVYTTPILHILPDITSDRGVPSASFRIDVREDVIPSSQLRGRCWYRAFSHPLFPVIVQGFPTARRPEGCPGLEFSYHAMVRVFGEIPSRAPFRLERGPLCLQLVDRIGADVFYWHDTNLPSGHGRCGGDYPGTLRHLHSDITMGDLRTGRHILCPCVEMQSDVAEGNIHIPLVYIETR